MYCVVQLRLSTDLQLNVRAIGPFYSTEDCERFLAIQRRRDQSADISREYTILDLEAVK